MSRASTVTTAVRPVVMQPMAPTRETESPQLPAARPADRTNEEFAARQAAAQQATARETAAREAAVQAEAQARQRAAQDAAARAAAEARRSTYPERRGGNLPP